MTTTIDEFGRVVIPDAMREHLGLKPGSIVQVEEAGDGVRIRPAGDRPRVALEGDILVIKGGVPGSDATDWVQVHREQRISDIIDANS